MIFSLSASVLQNMQTWFSPEVAVDFYEFTKFFLKNGKKILILKKFKKWKIFQISEI